MSADKRTVSTDAQETLAVEPVEAIEILYPGQRVGLISPGKAGACNDSLTVGIVDPFLTRAIMPRERFWLVLYPREITSLRHVWTHPAFEPFDIASVPSPLPMSQDKASAEAWLRRFCVSNDLSYTLVMESIGDLSNFDEYDGYGYLTIRGQDARGGVPCRPTRFTCSC